MTFNLYNGDCLVELKKLPDNSIDSCVTDPPYGLSFMGKHWDYDVPSKEIWEEVLRVLKPGGHLLSFGGSRTYHRMAVAIEDAGFEIRDQIMWLYGSGFPKSYNVGQCIEKLKTTGKTRRPDRDLGGLSRDRYSGSEEGKLFSDTGGQIDLTTDEAKQWAGWGTALKPAHEPVVVARKPIEEKNIAANVLKHGTGAINIDESRVGEGGKKWTKPRGGIWKTDSDAKAELVDNPLGRYPANVIHDGSDEVVSNFPNTGSGNGKGAYNYAGREYDNKKTSMFNGDKPQAPSNYNDNGSASRFFYCAKASKSDRDEGNSHPTVKPTDLMKYLVKLVTQKGGTVLDPFMGSGTTGKACGFEGFKFIGIERDKDYFEIAKARIEHAYQNKTVSLEDFFTD